MPKVLVGRHGQDRDNAMGILNGQRNEPLTDKGLEQAYQLANGIKEARIKIDAVRVSPLQRASLTGRIVANALGLPPPKVLHPIIERDFGIMTGKPVKDIELLCAPHIIKSSTITYFLKPPGAETFNDLLLRAGRAFDQLNAEHLPEETVLLLTHGDIGKMLYALHYGLHWEDVLTAFHLGNCELLALEGGSAPDTPHVIKVEQYNH